MGTKREEEGKKGENKFIMIIIAILSFLGIEMIFTIASFFYNGFLRQPQIRCVMKGDEKVFSEKSDFRNLSLYLHPQMVIRFDEHVILLVCLKQYYEEDHLIFDENREAKATLCHAVYAEKVQEYIKKEIISRVCLKNSDLSVKELDERLHIYVDTLGGVKYESKEGNEEKRYCIIERDGIVKDYDEYDEEIDNRLYAASLVMQDDLTGMETDEEIERFIEGVAEKIIFLAK